MLSGPIDLAGYRIEDELGEGGMARVYRAYDPRFDRFVALKILKPSEQADPALVARFLDEARNAGPLSHPNIVRVHRVDAQPQPFIDMELVEGPTLGVWLADRGGRVPWQDAVRIACDLASALEHAHRLGRVHRDVKPGNILMADDGRTPKLVDFGIAMIDRPEATRLTRHGEMVGTPRYMSPEQVRGEAVDARTDLYSLGAVLYEMLAGTPAVEGDSLVAVTTKIVTAQPKPLRGRVPDLPASLQSVVERLMAGDRSDRFANAAEARTALEACVGRQKQPASTSALRHTSAASGARPRGRVGLLAFIGVVAALSVLGTLLWLFLAPPGLPTLPSPPKDSDAPRETVEQAPAVPAPQNEVTSIDRTTSGASPEATQREIIARLGDQLRTLPCTRLESEPLDMGLGVRVASTAPDAVRGIVDRLGPAPASVDLRSVQLPASAVACGVFDLINRSTDPVSPRFLHLEAPDSGVCDAADHSSCYSGLGQGQLVAGERLVIVVDPPAGTGHMLVDYFMIDGNVAHLYPVRGTNGESIPAASYTSSFAGSRLVIGDGRAGAADENEYPVQAPFGHELTLAIAAAEPVFSSPRPFVEPIGKYLSDLADGLSRQPRPAKASALWVETRAGHN